MRGDIAVGLFSGKSDNKKSRRAKFIEKLDMYDMIIANLYSGNSIIEPTQKLDNSQLAIGFNNIASSERMIKYFMISKFPDYLQQRLVDLIRAQCMQPTVKINFYFYAQPHKINWDSAEMRNRMSIWKRYSQEHNGQIDVFSYRSQRGDALARQRIITSTKYLNEAELEYKRNLLSVFFVIEVSGARTETGLVNMSKSIDTLKSLCKNSDIKLSELRVNMIDWVKALSPFSLIRQKEVDNRFARRVLTDDLLANFNSFKQGRIGTTGCSLGIDVLNGGPVLYKFKADPDAADNWLISAGTGGGKSYWIKTALTYMMAEGYTVSIMDYEGDEYDNIANFVRAGNPDDVRVVSMGKGSAVYFDPCEIPELTGDDKVDCDLKDSAISFIMAIFRTINCGTEGNFTKEEERVMSKCIQRMYDTVGVTEDKNTWHRSHGLKLKNVYDELKELVESKELVDHDDDNLKHRAAVSILDSASIYFEPGEVKSGVFKKPMSANELYHAKLIVFSFGMKGADSSSTDPIVLALKQLSVAYVNIQISNYSKYVRKSFNVKVWEEFQRWGDIKGSSNTICNVITGGRKRGDINFIITNDLAALLDDDNKTNKTLRQNIQNYAIGSIPDEDVLDDFCDKFSLLELRSALGRIARATSSKSSARAGNSAGGSKYAHAFCLSLQSGERAIVKVMLPDSLRKSKLFKTGVDVDAAKEQ